MQSHWILIGVAGFLAYAVKGLIGTGSSAVLVSICALNMPAKSAVVMAALANLIGGLLMLALDRRVPAFRLWAPIAAWMAVGSIFGAALLKALMPQSFAIVLALAVIASGFWLIVAPATSFSTPQTSIKASLSDQIVSFIAGVLGGLVGINAPVLVAHFGPKFDKELLRNVLVVAFIPAAFVQTLSFIYLGELTTSLAIDVVAMLPGIVLGVVVGSMIFLRISERNFKILLGVLILFIGVRQLLTFIP